MKSKETMQQEIMSYLNKTSLHLFKLKKNYSGSESLYKITPFYKEGKVYYVIITINNSRVNLIVKEILPDYLYKNYGNNSLGITKSLLFGTCNATSIPNFANFKVLVHEILKEVSVDNNNTELIKKIEKRIGELSIFKSPIKVQQTFIGKLKTLLKK